MLQKMMMPHQLPQMDKHRGVVTAAGTPSSRSSLHALRASFFTSTADSPLSEALPLNQGVG
tara:strand:+ start:1649 stop:1831 length:183 start_codon:yes stop_codon:yes gene_type:complete